jgi:putative ABC transport system permease protein
MWAGQDPIGKRLMSGLAGGEGVTIVGIVPDTRYRELRDPRPSVYFPLRQSSFAFMPLNLAIRTNGTPSNAVPALRRAVAAAMPGVEVASALPFGTYMQKPLAQPRLNALLLAVFSVAAVVLAAIGLFGTMAAMVRQRTREIGIRVALGATNSGIRRMVIGRGLAISGAGLVVGLGAAVVANRALDALLYDVTPTDPVTLVVVSAMLLVVAFVACVLPARSTTRITPVTALRSD